MGIRAFFPEASKLARNNGLVAPLAERVALFIRSLWLIVAQK